MSKKNLKDYEHLFVNVINRIKNFQFRGEEKVGIEISLPKALVDRLDMDIEKITEEYPELRGHTLNRSRIIAACLMEGLYLEPSNKGSYERRETFRNEDALYYSIVKKAILDDVLNVRRRR